MKTSELEQLVSEHLDCELPEAEATAVEKLLRQDIQAKKIHDEILMLRKAIRSIPEPKLPKNFQEELFKKIAAKKVSGSNFSETVSAWNSCKNRKQWFSHPGVWGYPLVVIFVAVSLPFFTQLAHFRNPEEKIAKNIEKTSAFGGSDSSEDVIHVPLADKFHRPLTGNPQLPFDHVLTNSTPIEITCQLSPKALEKQYLLKIFAERNLSSVTKTNGFSTSVVYELNLSPAQLMGLLETMGSDKKSVTQLIVPNTVASLYNRETSDAPVLTTVRVQFIVKNAFK